MDSKKANVILIPTKDRKSIIHISKDSNNLLFGERIKEHEPYTNLTSQHLHISNRTKTEIGDYCILFSVSKLHNTEDNGIIGKVTFKTLDGIELDGVKYSYDYIEPQKLIASTDTSLGLPKLSQHFIDTYVEEYNDGNIIEEVLIKYEQVNKFGQEVTYEDLDYPEITGDYDFKMIPKVNSEDNTISIEMIKDKWNKDEVLELLDSYRKFMNKVSNSSKSSLVEWASKNL